MIYLQKLLKSYLQEGSGRTAVRADCVLIGEDLLIVLSGEGQHIGGCSFAEPYMSKESKSATVSSISRKEHQDIEMTRLVAQEVAKQLGVVVIAIGGIHIENATKEEIKQILGNARSLSDRLINAVAANLHLKRERHLV